MKSVRADDGVELTDGRVLDKSFREFLPGYAVTSYGSQGKTVDYVLFSDSTVKAATNAQQWYVTISRGRRGIRIFTPDKEQMLRAPATDRWQWSWWPVLSLAGASASGNACTGISSDLDNAPPTRFVG